jgi:hypothetical protein
MKLQFDVLYNNSDILQMGIPEAVSRALHYLQASNKIRFRIAYKFNRDGG